LFFVVLKVIIRPMRNLFFYLKNKNISFLFAIIIILIISGIFIFWLINHVSKIKYPIAVVKIQRIVRPPKPGEKKEHPKPLLFSMDDLKTKGCVADGLLSGYGNDTENSIVLINRSNCKYLHRSIETWADTPDFEKADELMWKLKPDVIYGMFIAEALRKNAEYYWPDKDRDFRFSDMCRGHTDGRWGEHTCIPSFEKEEYREYVKYITRRAMDLGVQSFLFGQIYLQDAAKDRDHSKIYGIVKDMRKYAEEKGIQIAIGAQTGSTTDEKYLRLFDYIEGGVGIDSQGNVENGPCLSRKESCWALLWNEKFKDRANNVIVHLDWSGLSYDDMSVFARMDQGTRINTLKNLYKKFTSQDVGFLMPYLATIHKENGGCHGPMKRFYSPDNKYSCKDEDAMKAILAGK
jgi:hypothetical protein